MGVWSDTDGDAISDTSQMFLVLGVIGLLILFSLGELTFKLFLGLHFIADYVKKKINEKIILTLSLCLTGIGSLVMINFGNGVSMTQFVIGSLFVWSIASPISQTLIISTFSTILQSKTQGTMMGWIGTAGR